MIAFHVFPILVLLFYFAARLHFTSRHDNCQTAVVVFGTKNHAFADDAFTADSATYKQDMTAYYTAYQQYSSQASSASSKWAEYANGLYATPNISIYGLFA